MANEDPQQPEFAEDDPFGDRNSDSDSDYPSGYDTASDIEEEARNVLEGKPSAPGQPKSKPSKSPEQVILEMYRDKLQNEDRRRQNMEKDFLSLPDEEEQFDFPEDREQWKEEDLKELWADGPVFDPHPGWDPVMADEEDWELMEEEMKDKEFPLAPFYVPYRKYYPLVPDIEPPRPSWYEEKRFRLFKRWHHDIQTPKDAIHELDRIEEFLKWVSFVFPDGTSYEGTVWDDLAHGKGVYVADQGLVRYEGEWMRNDMEGHGVIEVDIPDIEPLPGSKLEERMRAEGKIIKRDYMDPEDRKWLEMDMEDSALLAKGKYVTPVYENKEWVRLFGRKPEKGRYRYAGQWKHGRMHGCGVYEVNERTLFGRFYFGELLDEPYGCDDETSALHAGIAEVAAAKARMFINKPDGMVREQRGPYSDPQHPYFYEEEDSWQAPGFVNQFYEVPDYWKTYVQEVDHERELWLNSFYKAPLRLAMPAELEHWWENEEDPEFVIVNKEPEPDPEDPSKLIYSEDPLILHTKTGRLINYVEDEEHGIRLFWQPPTENGEEVDPSKVQFLPLGFDEMEEQQSDDEEDDEEKEKEKKKKPGKMAQKLLNWAEKQKKEGEMRKKLLHQELELVEAELCLEEAIEDMEEDTKTEGKEAVDQMEVVTQQEEDSKQVDSVVPPRATVFEEKALPEVEGKVEEDMEEEEEEDDEDAAPSSFGTVSADQDSITAERKGNGSRKSPFSTLSFSSPTVISTIPSRIHQSFLSWKKKTIPQKICNSSDASISLLESSRTVSFHTAPTQKNLRIRATIPPGQELRAHHNPRRRAYLRSGLLKMHQKEPRSWNIDWLHVLPQTDSDCILSLHIPTDLHHLDPNMGTAKAEVSF
ncbi:hypothetical protein V2J09_006398 [Rumex salicifolius]